jgi:membrane-bound acyltransferase YfiQ involved in biofilm formation
VFSNRSFLTVLLIILAISLVFQQLSWYKVIDYNLTKGGGVGLLIGLTGTILLFRLRWKINWLIWIGSYAYSIYLFHAFGTAGGRIIIKAMGIHVATVIFIVSLLAGILVPVFAELVFDRFKLTRMLLLGRSYQKKGKDE